MKRSHDFQDVTRRKEETPMEMKYQQECISVHEYTHNGLSVSVGLKV